MYEKAEEEWVDARFKKMFRGLVQGDNGLMSLSTIDLMFFPVLSIDHYSLICFDLKNPSIFIIDSLDMKMKKSLSKVENKWLINIQGIAISFLQDWYCPCFFMQKICVLM